MKKDQERLEKQLGETQTENRRLLDPLQKAKEEVAELQKQLASYERDKISLRVSRQYTYIQSIIYATHLITVEPWDQPVLS